MKILIINQHKDDFLGGSELQCDIIANYLTKFGHEVIYGAVNARKEKYDTIYQVYPLNHFNIFTLFSFFRRNNPDVIYWRFDRNKFLLSVLIAKILNIKFVFSVAHIDNLKIYPIKQIESDLHNKLRSIASNIKRFFGIINYLGFYFVDGIIVNNADWLESIPSFIDKRITIRNSMSLTLSKEFQWERPFVLWVANIKKAKNPEDYIRLTDKLKDFNVDLLMVGKIQGREYNKILTKDNLPDNFYYLGPKTFPEVNSILKESLFLVHTCSPEGFPNIFIQAWLLGKPTITLYFDPENIIEREGLGLYSGEFNNFVEDTKRLLKNKKKRHEMGEKAREFSRQNFRPETNIKQLETFLKNIK
ncbi:MAG: glycosyltransferase family 4 protein [Candidatus Paceibacterota bacterium]